jgi:hypothetical protein
LMIGSTATSTQSLELAPQKTGAGKRLEG